MRRFQAISARRSSCGVGPDRHVHELEAGLEDDGDHLVVAVRGCDGHQRSSRLEDARDCLPMGKRRRDVPREAQDPMRRISHDRIE
jgi:hypothetical protein